MSGLQFFDLFDSQSWNPLIGIIHLLATFLSFFISFDTKSVANITYTLL
jgi:hypothetical protein